MTTANQLTEPAGIGLDRRQGPLLRLHAFSPDLGILQLKRSFGKSTSSGRAQGALFFG